jgi:hypothetical protein
VRKGTTTGRLSLPPLPMVAQLEAITPRGLRPGRALHGDLAWEGRARNTLLIPQRKGRACSSKGRACSSKGRACYGRGLWVCGVGYGVCCGGCGCEVGGVWGI